MPKYSASYEPVHEHVRERIKSMIARNFSTGDLLPKYRDLAKVLGVGLPAVIKAMSLLSEEGIVKPVCRDGYWTVPSGKMHFIGPDQLHGF